MKFVATNINSLNKIILVLVATIGSLQAQESINEDSLLLLWGTQNLDTLAIKNKAFTVEDFIDMTKKDTSFYKAFKNMRMINHKEYSKVVVHEKKEVEGEKQIKASMKRTSLHTTKGKVANIEILKETTKGKYYKRKGKHRYFTGEMFDHVFFPPTPMEANNIVKGGYQQQEPEKKGRLNKYYEQLKTFMFSPGTGVEGVPLIGDKLNIFTKEMRPYYDFTLEKVNNKDGIACYKFVCKKKPEVKDSKVVILFIETFYDRRTMNILSRRYQIKDKTILFDFDIKMWVELQKIDKDYFPKEIRYLGNWDVPLKKRERLAFVIKTELQ